MDVEWAYLHKENNTFLDVFGSENVRILDLEKLKQKVRYLRKEHQSYGSVIISLFLTVILDGKSRK